MGLKRYIGGGDGGGDGGNRELIGCTKDSVVLLRRRSGAASLTGARRPGPELDPGISLDVTSGPPPNHGAQGGGLHRPRMAGAVWSSTRRLTIQ